MTKAPHLLIAGYGLLGKCLHEAAAERGWLVTSLNRSADGAALACDITDPQALEQLHISPTHIVHCASSGRGGGPGRYREVYIGGCESLLQVFPHAHLTFTGSSSVYAQTDGSVVTETSPTEPSRATGQILLEAEAITLRAGGTVTRLTGLYDESRSHQFRKFISGEAEMEEDGSRIINQVHREDAASAILHLIEKNQTGIFNVSDGQHLTQKQLYTQLSRLTGKAMPPSVPRKLDSKRGWSDKKVSIEKLKASGWQPRYPDFLKLAEKWIG